MRISDWSSDVCSSDLRRIADPDLAVRVQPDDPLARPFEPARDRHRRVGGNAARHHQLRVPYRVVKAMPRLPIGRAAADPELIMPAVLVPLRIDVHFDLVEQILVVRPAVRSEEHTSELQSL